MKKKGLLKIRSFLFREPQKIVKIMKLNLLFIFLLSLNLSGNVFSQHVKVSLDLKEVSMQEFFKAIKQETGISFLYNYSLLEDADRISVQVKDKYLDELLTDILGKQGLTFTYQNGAVIIKKQKVLPVTEEKQRFITGKVTDNKKLPLPGVSVYFKGMRVGTATDIDGNYKILMTDSTDILMFSFIGMKTVYKKYTGQNTINVIMEEDHTALEEVTVVSTGYQDIDKRKLTSSVVSIKMDDIQTAGLSTVTQMLEGRIPGMTFMQNSGQVGATPKVRIRGTSTIIGNQEPLWVVDGIVQQDPVNVDPAQLNDLDFVNLLGNAITGLNPDDIEQIDVLKDAASTAIYGARAANGVIVITTKKGKVGKPTVNYSLTGTFNRRPYYSDKEVYLMNSKQRVDVSREQFQRNMFFSNILEWSGFEKAYTDYKSGRIGYDEYKQQADYYETINTDWFDILCKNSFSNKHTISLSGGTPEFRYYASFGYHDEKGVIRKEGKETFTSALKLNGTYKRFSFLFGVQFNTSEADHVPNDATGKNIVQYAYETSRAIPAYNPDGTPYYYTLGNLRSTANVNLFNMEEEMRNSKNHISSNSVTLTGNLRWQALDYLNVEGTISYQSSRTNQETTFNEKTYYIKQLDGNFDGSLCPLGGEWRNVDTRQRSYTGRMQLNFHKTLDREGKHFLNLSLGGEISSSKYNNLSLVERGYYEKRGRTFAQFTPDMLKSDEYSKYLSWLSSNFPGIQDNLTNLLSGYFTATYSYDNRYTLNFNTRMDGSNQFGSRSNEKLLPIWSISGRWDIGNEFWKDNANVNELALKLSYGKQGNMLDNQTSKMIIQKGAYDGWFDSFQSTIAHYPNPDLKWETTTSYNAEITFSLLQNKIIGTVGYFYKKTKDAFLNKTISEVNGITNYVINKGTLTNQGVEVSLSFTPINQTVDSRGKRGFVWRFDPQIGQVVNSLVNKAINNKTNTVLDKITYSDFLNGTVQFSGKPLHTFYSYRFKGLSHEDGSPIYYGLEKEREEELNARFQLMSNEEICMEVMEESGTRVPVLQGGFSNYFGYRQFGLSFNFTYSLGNKIRLLKLCDDMTIRPYPVQNVRREMVNRWRQPGDEAYTNIPSLVTQNTLPQGWWGQYYYNGDYEFADVSPYRMYDYSDIRVVKGDYLKLQSLSFRYNVHESFCKKIGIQSAYLSITGTNLFTIANKALKGQDVTQSGSSPTINLSVRPNYSISFNVTF